ncbi:MAG: glutamate-1-semialdehyde 2,1-aminomutase [Propioniciclava sp.]
MDSNEAFARARRVMPGGVSSPVRAYRAVGGTPVFLARAEGAHVYDLAGCSYVDLVGSWGPAVLGHGHPSVVAAVQRAAAAGLSLGAPTWGEVELAETVQARVAAAEKVRFVSTGTEATMTAIRLARAATGRELVIKFAGCYHGHSDGLLAEAGSGVATAGLPGSAGVTSAVAGQTVVLPFNDLAALAQAFVQYPDQIAAVITEPAAANMGVIPPEPGFNTGLRQLCTEHGALLIFDEVLTGFRVGPAGWWGRECPDDSWRPDLLTFGKVVGGGMPLAALAGRADLMDLLAPEGPVYQAGTLSGNPLATAAGIATLAGADDDVYARIETAAHQLQDAVIDALTAAGVPHRLQRAGSLFSVFWGSAPAASPIVDYAGATGQDTALFSAFFHSLREDGVLLPPSAFEAWFLSAAHTDAVLATVRAALPRAAAAAARAGDAPAVVPRSASVPDRPAPAAGTVTLVSGGPGDPGLITVAGLTALRRAEVVLYDHLAPLELLSEVPTGAELIDVGKIPRGPFTAQEEINRLLVERAQAGREVVRFKGGDAFVFGRGGEECQACAAAGVPVVVIPGVTSSIAGPAMAGIPVTHRGVSQGFTVISAHVGPEDPRSTLNWDALAQAGTTLVVLMGVATLAEVCSGLVRRGLGPQTPAAVIEQVGRPGFRVVRAPVSELADAATATGVLGPAVTIIGAVADLDPAWVLGPD